MLCIPIFGIITFIWHGRSFDGDHNLRHLLDGAVPSATPRQVRRVEESLTQVAFACGFCDVSRFSKDFSRAYGEAPSAVRNRSK